MKTKYKTQYTMKTEKHVCRIWRGTTMSGVVKWIEKGRVRGGMFLVCVFWRERVADRPFKGIPSLVWSSKIWYSIIYELLKMFSSSLHLNKSGNLMWQLSSCTSLIIDFENLNREPSKASKFSSFLFNHKPIHFGPFWPPKIVRKDQDH